MNRWRLVNPNTPEGPMSPVSGAFHRLLLATWFGGTLFFAGAVAPVAFHVLPNHALAGSVVNGCLHVLYSASYWLLGALFLGYLPSSRRVPRVRTKLAIVAAAFAFNAVGDRLVVPRMDALRTAIGPAGVESVAATDPRRAEFGRLHHLSEGLMGLELLGGAVLLVLG